MKLQRHRILFIFTILAAGFIAKETLYDRVSVEGESMLPTFRPGEKVLVSRLAYGFQLPFTQRYILLWRALDVGDIVVFHDPLEGRPVVKRCLAVAGQRLQVEKNLLIVDGIALPISAAQSEFFRRNSLVPFGAFFAAGDNAAASIDSRHFGYVSVRELIGRIPVREAG